MSAADWEELAPRWERGRELLFESTRAVSEWLVDGLEPKVGQTILDVAAGTGETGFLVSPMIGEAGRLIVSDRSPHMVEAAERLASRFGVSNAEFRVLDAERLDLPDASVDGVVCRFGYVLKGDPPAALTEIRRVLRPDGRFAFAVWAAREQNAWMTVPSEVMVEHGWLDPPSQADVRLSARRNPETIERLLRTAGFSRVEFDEMPLAYRFANPEELWFFVSELRGPVATALSQLPEEERAVARAEIERRATPALGGGFELGGVSVNAVAS